MSHFRTELAFTLSNNELKQAISLLQDYNTELETNVLQRHQQYLQQKYQQSTPSFRKPQPSTRPPPPPSNSTQSQPIPQLPPPKLPVLETLPEYVLSYETDSIEHQNKQISTLVFTPAITVSYLPPSPGWLLSSSDGLINLWRMNESPTIILEKSKPTIWRLLSSDVASVSSTAESSHFLGCCTDLNFSNSGLSLFSLNNGRLDKTNDCPDSIGATQVVSSFNDSLINSPGTSTSTSSIFCGCQEFICSIGLTPSSLSATSKYTFTNSIITSLSLLSQDLNYYALIGDSQGKAFLWDNKGAAPKTLLQGNPTPISTIDNSNHGVLTGGVDGVLQLWDIKKTSTPLRSLNLDGSSIVNLKNSPFSDLVAISTLKDLYLLSTKTFQFQSLGIKEKCSSLAWNLVDKTSLHCANTAGSILTFSKVEKK